MKTNCTDDQLLMIVIVHSFVKVKVKVAPYSLWAYGF